MTTEIRPIPEGFHTITPYLVVHDAPAAIEYYRTAFGAKERTRLIDPDSNHVRHCELDVGDSKLYITDVPLAPETQVPRGQDTSPVWLYLYLADPDGVFDKAVRAGAAVVTPMTDAPWGDRYGCVCDPFGYRWGIAARRENVSKQEIEARMRRS
jgi:PhnB protein